MTTEWIMVGLGVLLTLGTGVFVAAEFSLVNLDRADLEARQSRGERRLDPVIGALKITSTHLSGAQLGITLTTLLTGFTFEPALAALLSPVLRSAGLPAGSVPVLASVLGILVATVASMLFGELMPKNFAIAVPVQVAKIVMPLQAGFTTIFKPLVALLNGTANAVVRSLGVEPREELSGARTADELTSLVRRSALEGTLETERAALLYRSLRFADRVAADVMTARVRLETLRAGDTAQTVVERARHTGVSRFPVLGIDVDDVVGLVHVKSAYAVPPTQRHRVAAESIMVQALQVPDTVGVIMLLSQLRRAPLLSAVVVDEYGGTAGLVTIEDLIEELIGEVSDEHDRETPRVVADGDELIIDASLRPDELRAISGLRIPEGPDYETVAGFVTGGLGRLAEPGDEVTVTGGSLLVLSLDERRIDRVRFVPQTTTDAADAEEDR